MEVQNRSQHSKKSTAGAPNGKTRFTLIHWRAVASRADSE